MKLPFTVYRSHYRTSTYVADTIRTLANIVDRFKPDETYNIGGSEYHSIEELAEIAIKVTDGDRSLIQYSESEAMTTRVKRIDVSKAIKDLDHKNRYTLEEGMKLTADWMRKIYKPI